MSANVGARQLGDFGGPRRAIIRQPKNPIDKSTIVSIYPKQIAEHKHAVEPGVFNLPPGSLESPSILVVGSSSWWKPMGENQPTLEIPVSSVNVANAVINDYCNGMLGCDMVNARPGLFFLLGEMSLFDVKTKCKEALQEADEKQKNWYRILVRIADSLWARANGNPLTISDEMRLAAKSLNMNDKPWLLDFKIVEMKPCVACGSLKNPAYPVCATCKAVDMSHPAAKELKFAQ